MPFNKQEKSYYVSKTAIGGLYKALAMDTDPAHTLYFTSALINSSRAALIQKLEDKVENYQMIPTIMSTVLKLMNTKWNPHGISIEGRTEINKQIDDFFKSESMLQYGAEIYRDILFCDDLLTRWNEANEIYLHDKNAWAFSNGRLVLIHKVLFEIIFRHELMQLPKNVEFNVDTGISDLGILAQAIRQRDENGGQRARSES